MRRLRAASLLLAFLAAAGLVLGTAGFAAMSADRGLGVSLGDDETAFVGYDTLTDTVHGTEPTPIVEYENRFGHDLETFDVDVSIVDPDDTDAEIVDVDTPDGLDEDAMEPVSVTLACPAEEAVHLQFEATGSGAGVSVSIDRVHTVTCVPEDDPDGPTVTGVHYNDAANADVSVDDDHGEVVANVWITENPPVNSTDAIEPVVFDETEPLDTAKKVRPEIVQSRAPSDLPDGWKIVAVEFPDQDVAYVHPQWDAGEYDTPKTGDGVAFTELPLDANTLLHASVEDGELVVANAAGGSAGILIDWIFQVDTSRTAA